MCDSQNENDGAQAISIVLAQVGKAYWLLDGETHLDAMLSNVTPYPTPVHCLRFSSMGQLADMLPEGQATDDLWGIHPGIIERLKSKDELIVLDLPETD
jgi:hypothetical protein